MRSPRQCSPGAWGGGQPTPACMRTVALHHGSALCSPGPAPGPVTCFGYDLLGGALPGTHLWVLVFWMLAPQAQSSKKHPVLGTHTAHRHARTHARARTRCPQSPEASIHSPQSRVILDGAAVVSLETEASPVSRICILALGVDFR